MSDISVTSLYHFNNLWKQDGDTEEDRQLVSVMIMDVMADVV